VIGNNVKIQNSVSVYTGVILEDDVFLGPSMVFTNVINPRSHVNRRGEYMVTRVKRGATIGANATVVCGSTLGEYSFVGAGVVVTKDVPPYALVYGTPAKIQGWMCQCGIKLPFNGEGQDECVACAECGLQYQKSGEEIQQIEEEK
jgi:UDP-2-acetamido-3-amino-2,3-dideoxy-glucuronate N-acetyltransferase